MSFTLKFLKRLPLYEKVQPYKLHGYPDLGDDLQTNCVYEEIDGVLAEDLRSSGHRCLFDQEGFEILHAPSQCALNASTFETDGQHEDATVQAYIQETMNLFRRNDSAAFPTRLEAGDTRKQAISVATTTLTDQDFSYDGGYDRIQRHITKDEWQRVQKGTVKPLIVNVWRPLRTVHNAPLILADRRTVEKDDLVESDQVMRDRLNKTAYVYYRKSHRWYWMSCQRPDEVIMFASWVPPSDAPHADCSPHAAGYRHFPDSASRPRESVEVRLMVLLPANHTAT